MILNVLLPEEKEKVVNTNGQQSWLVFQLHLRAQILNSWSFKVVKTGSSSEFAQICSTVSQEQHAVQIFKLMLYNEELWPISEADYHLKERVMQDSVWGVEQWKPQRRRSNTWVNRIFSLLIISSDRSSYSDSGLYYSVCSSSRHFLRFRAFLPTYLVFRFENWMQIDNNWPWGPWGL